MADVSKIFKPRRGKASTMAGTKASTVLGNGEMFIEVPNTGSGSGHSKMKIGDGTTPYSTLPYAMGDTENDEIAFSSNTATTVATALNSVTSGGKLKNLIAGLKQAVSLCNTSITKLNDDILNKTYPVGAIYMSVLNTNPSTLFGGTWVQLQDRFLLGASTKYTAGSTGGSETVSLTISQIPAHTHSFSGTTVANSPNHFHYLQNAGTCGSEVQGYGLTNNGPGFKDRVYISMSGHNTDLLTGNNGSIHTHFYSGNTESTGYSSAHNNMPSYLAVYMWKRTA